MQQVRNFDSQYHIYLSKVTPFSKIGVFIILTLLISSGGKTFKTANMANGSKLITEFPVFWSKIRMPANLLGTEIWSWRMVPPSSTAPADCCLRIPTVDLSPVETPSHQEVPVSSTPPPTLGPRAGCSCRQPQHLLHLVAQPLADHHLLWAANHNAGSQIP